MMFTLLTHLALACQLDVTPGSAGSLTWTTDCAGELRVQLAQQRWRHVERVPAADGGFDLPPATAAALRAGTIDWRVQHPDGTEVRGRMSHDVDTDGDGVTALQGDCDDVEPRFVAFAVGPAGVRNLSGAVLDAAATGGVADITLVDEDLFFCGGGTHPVNVVVAGGVSSVSGDAVLDGQGGPVLHVTGGADVAVRGLTLTNGDRALWCEGSTVSFDDAVLTGNTGSGGGAVAAADCDVTVTDTVVSDNVSTQGGGGFRMDLGSTLTLTRATVSGNSCTVNGGGVELVGSHGVCDQSQLWSNTAADGGNVYLVNGGSLDMVQCDMGMVGTANDAAPNDILSWNGQTTRVYPADVVANNVCRADGTCGTITQTPSVSPQWTTVRVDQLLSNFSFMVQYPVGSFTVDAVGVDVGLLTQAATCSLSIGTLSDRDGWVYGPRNPIVVGRSSHQVTFSPPLQIPADARFGDHLQFLLDMDCDRDADVEVLLDVNHTSLFTSTGFSYLPKSLSWMAYNRL